MSNAGIDQNSRQTLTALSSTDGVTIVPLWADPVTHRLLTDQATASGTVTSVATGTGLTGGPITTTGTISLATSLQPMATLTGNALKFLRVNAGETAVEYASVSGTGTVTSVSVVSANGFAGTVATATTTPAITLSTTITGVLKGNGTAISAATDGTDYLSSTTGLKLDQTSQQTIANNSPIFGSLTASQLVATDASKALTSLAVATYPSLTEISYVKGVTSAIQTQLNAKGAGTVTATGGALTANSIVLGAGTTDTKVVAGVTTDGTSIVNLGVNATTAGKVKLFGGTSGDVTIAPTAVAGTATVQTLPATTGTLVNRVTTANGVSASNSDGALTVSLGVITPTSVNGLTISSTTGTLTLTNAKTLAVTNTLTLSGTDSTTMTFPTTSATIARTDAAQTFTGTQTFAQQVMTNNAITASANAATVPITSRISTVTNNSAATLTITITTTSAVDGMLVQVRVLDFSAVAQTITWVNTENGEATAPTTSNGSTTLPRAALFQYNNATSKWRCLAS